MKYITNPEEATLTLRKCLRKNGWIDLVKLVKQISPEAINGYVNAAYRVMDQKDQPDINKSIINSDLLKVTIAQFTNIPIEYIIKKELFDEFATASKINESLLTSEVFKLPYPIVALRVEDEEVHRYFVVMETEDTFFMARTFVGDLEKNITMGELYKSCRSEEDREGFTSLGCILSYITNNKDIITKSKISEIVTSEQSKVRKKKNDKIKEMSGVVGGKFVSAMRRWRENQEREYNENPLLRGTKRPHCRAGHWNTYWAGKGRTERRVIFIHQCLINAEKIGDVEIQRTVG